MKKLFRFIRLYYREIFRAFYFIIAIATIVSFLPREGRFKYEFQKGKPWMHNDMVAPFDFPIYKTDSELITERNTILINLKPYFRIDSTAIGLAIEEFRNDFLSEKRRANLDGKTQKQTTDSLELKIEEYIRFIHLKGVIKPDDLIELRERLNSGITIIVNNIAYNKSTDDFYTVSQALELLQEQKEKLISSLKKEDLNIINKLNLSNYIIPNLSYDSKTTERISQDMLTGISQTKGLIFAGERIVSKGENITPELYQILFSLKKEFESRTTYSINRWTLIGGQTLIVTIIFVVLFLFLLNFRKEILLYDSKIIFILLLITLMTVVSSLLIRRDFISVYIIPFAIVPIFIRTFYDSRLALFIHLVTLFLVGFFVPNSFEFLFVHFIAGIISIISISNVYRRGKLFLCVLYILISYLLVYLGIVTIQEGNPWAIDPLSMAWFTGNALLLLATYQLIYLFEKVFGFLSDTTLMELSDTNQDLLRKLAEAAPGTFQHSLQVANLAESATQKIGGNPLLVRAGALYHDIGKILKPYYFIENQSPDFNPHKGIDFEESASIIINHVNDGVQLARKHGLPEQIIDFIITHHGTNKVQYFYRLFREKFPEATDELVNFTYPGPKPFSKETAVLMMADSVEAASRALKNISVNTIEDLVDSIINYQQIEEQFNEANITFRDITIIKSVFKKKLINIYHARIEYPKENIF